jgi:hypothetical protein
MIDELAKAIDEASIAWSKENHGLSKWDVPSDLIARALLRRLRDRVTGEMIQAGLLAEGWEQGEPEIIFRAMIDAALEERGA